MSDCVIPIKSRGWISFNDGVFDLVRQIIYKSFGRRNIVGSSLWNRYWYDYSYIYIYIYICIYLKLLYIDIKSSSYVHEFYTSKYIPILLTTMFFKPPMHIMHVCSAQFDFTWTLYTTEFTWTLYTKDNTVYIHLRMYTCFMLFLIVCSIVFINMSVFVSNYAIKIFNKKYIHNELGCWQCKCEHT